MTLSPISTFLAGAAILYLARWVCIEINHWLFARKLGCKPAHVRRSKLPLGLDNVLRMAKAAKNQELQNDDQLVHQEMGCPSTWVQNFLGFWCHTTVDPENIKAILATQFKDFEMGPFRTDTLSPLLGHGIFTSNGKEWQHHRALLRPQFTRNQISSLELEEVHIQHLFGRFHHGADGSWTSPIDLGPLFFNLTLDSATEFLFGQSVDSQLLDSPNAAKATSSEHETKANRDSKDWSSFGRAFDRANTTISFKGMLMDFHFLYSPKSFTDDCNTVHRFADYFVQQALNEEQEVSGSPDSKGETEAFVFLRELVKSTKDPKALRGQLLNILLAGRDTTAGLLGWTFYLLARHPDYYSKFHRIIVETFGPYSEHASSLTFESLKACSHLQNLLSEVLRLHPVVPENSRRATRNTMLPRGGGVDGNAPVYIRKGEEVIYNVNVMHRRKDIWGDDADEFRPQRWIGSKHGWEYLPFNGGPRICLGQQFALTEAGFVVVRLLQRYSKIENLDTETVTKHQYTLTTAPVKVLVRFCEAAQL
ncbi:Cytochrome P450 52A13 [Beauveria bassiana]|nr:Cytochrome P450 52A13 [Beauveria bassiana]